VRFQLLLIACVLLVIFIGGELRQADLVNVNLDAADQSSYIDYAKNLRTSHFQYIGDRNRMPVYPSLMALLYRPGMTDEEFFDAGKRVGIAVAIIVLVAAFLVFWRYVQFMEASTVALVAAFTVFAYKAPYFQADVLFYGLAFVLFVLMIELVLRPRLVVALATGLVAGIAHLTKAAVLPGLIMSLLCLLLRAALATTEDSAHGESPIDESNRTGQRILRRMLCAGLTTAVFLAVVFPYIHTSKARFGHYFYNVNSTFYMWCDSWAEAVAGPRAHGDRDGWPDMPPDKIPNMGKYLHEHSVQQMAGRLVNGVSVLRTAIIRSYGYAPFVLIYVCLGALLVGQNSEHFIPLAQRKTSVILLLFLVSYFAIYIALYAWYTPIVTGNRLVLGLFLPAMFCLVWVLDYASKHGLAFHIYGRQVPASAGSAFILIALVAYVLLIFPDQISRMPGGH